MTALDDMLPLTPGTFHVLLALHGGARHGYGIKKDVRERSGGRIDLDAGGLYRLIGRLEAVGLVRTASAPASAPDDDRHRVFYKLTSSGERVLAAEARRLATLVGSPDVAALLKASR